MSCDPGIIQIVTEQLPQSPAVVLQQLLSCKVSVCLVYQTCCFYQRVDQLTHQCKDVIHLLQKSIGILQSTPVPADKQVTGATEGPLAQKPLLVCPVLPVKLVSSLQEAELLLSKYKAVMGSILEDVRLVQLQREGGASLSLLRREEGGDGVSEEQRAAVEEVSSLYDKVDELLHLLVTLSNAKTQELNFILDFRNLEQDFSLVSPPPVHVSSCLMMSWLLPAVFEILNITEVQLVA